MCVPLNTLSFSSLLLFNTFFSEHTPPYQALLQFSEAKRQLGSKEQDARKIIRLTIAVHLVS